MTVKEIINKSKWKELPDEFVKKAVDEASAGLIEGSIEWKYFRMGVKFGLRKGYNYEEN